MPRRSWADVVDSRPLSQMFYFSINADRLVLYCVGTLFQAGCPSAITRLVITVIVDAFERMIGRWFRPHVGYKISEFLPPFTDANTTTTVAVIAVVFWIPATLPHP